MKETRAEMLERHRREAGRLYFGRRQPTLAEQDELLERQEREWRAAFEPPEPDLPCRHVVSAIGVYVVLPSIILALVIDLLFL